MEDVEPTHSPQLGLFKDKFYTDWVVLLGVITSALGAYAVTKDYGRIDSLVAYDWFALSIDVGIAAGLNCLLFGYLPALGRWRFNKKPMSTPESSDFMPQWKYFLLVALISGGVTIAGLNTNDPAGPAGTVAQRCMPKGSDELCVEAEYLGNKKILLTSSWNYASPQFITGSQVSRIQWVSRIDCNTQVGYVESLSGFDVSGNQVSILFDTRNEMMRGLESEQLRPSIPQMCSRF
jgi:hypothetical protein